MQTLYSTYNKQLWISNPDQQTWLENTPANLYDERLWPLSI